VSSTQNITPDVAVAQEQPDEPRVSRLSGKIIEPIKRKPEIVVRMELRPDDGPVAKRAEPRPAPAVAVDHDLDVLERAVKHDDQAERDALSALQRELRATMLKDVEDTAKAVEAFQQEHGSFFARTQAALRSGELLVKAGQGSRDRLARLDRLVGDAVRLFGNSMVSQIEKAISEISVEELAPRMTSLDVGRDGFAIPGRTRIQRLAAGFQREGVLRDLNEKLESARIIVGELAARIAENEAAGLVAKGVRIYTPAEIDQARAMSPSRASSGRIDNGGPPGNEDDWDPLMPETWKRGSR
jgi:hypothetical protein